MPRKSRNTNQFQRLSDIPEVIDLTGTGPLLNHKHKKNLKHPTNKCDICHKDVNDEIELGKFMEKSGIRVHYYCLLVSTHLPQNGNDSGGILGFLIRDIKNEMRANNKNVCCFCNEKHASSKCQNCSRYYHLDCGLKNNCLFQYADEFNTYCQDHHGISHDKVHSEHYGCYICLLKMGPYNPTTSIRASCCNHKGWAHRRCLKEYALSAGYYLKCLWCNSKEFRNEARLLGIFVPDREAAWEHKGAFACLYKRYSRCDAEECLCNSGRDYNSNTSKWQIIVCNTCASYGMHLECFSTPPENLDEYQCTTCRDIYDRIPNTPDTTLPNRKNKSSSDLDNSLFIFKPQTQSQCFYPCEEVDSSSSYTEKANIAPPFNSSIMQINEPHSPSQSFYLCEEVDSSSSYTEKANIAAPFNSNIMQKNEPYSPPLNYAQLKIFVSVNPEDMSTYKCEFRDSKGDVVRTREVIGNDDLQMNDELVNKLVAELKSDRQVRESVVIVSDSDDSVASVGELLETIIKNKKTYEEVPKPRKLGAMPSACSLLSASNFLSSNNLKDSSNDSYYGVSSNGLNIEPKVKRFSNDQGYLKLSTNAASCLNLNEKMQLFFNNFRPDPYA